MHLVPAPGVGCSQHTASLDRHPSEWGTRAGCRAAPATRLRAESWWGKGQRSCMARVRLADPRGIVESSQGKEQAGASVRITGYSGLDCGRSR